MGNVAKNKRPQMRQIGIKMKKKKIIQIFLLLLSIGIFILIFNFSNQDGEKSEGQSRTIANEIVNIIEKVQNTKFDNRKAKLNEVDHVIRKLAHFSIYTMAGIALMLFVSTFNLKNLYKILTCVLIGFIYACSDELHQTFIPGRTAYFSDVLIDTSGVLVGSFTILYVITKYFERKK